MKALALMIIGLVLAGTGAGCHRASALLTVYSDNGSMIYRDDTGRSCKIGMNNGTIVILIDKVARWPAICEPYPTMEQFASIVIVAREGKAQMPGSIFWMEGARPFVGPVESLSRRGDAIFVRASLPDRVVRIDIMNPVESRFENVQTRVEHLTKMTLDEALRAGGD